jgi:transketolase
VYLRLGREAGPDVFDADYVFEPGRVLLLREGTEVLLVSTGQQTARTLEAAERLGDEGIGAGVLHVPTVKPCDEAAIAAAAVGVAAVVTVEEHTVLGGLGGLVAEILATHGDPRPLVRIGIEDAWGASAPNDWLLERHGLTPQAIAERVRRIWP